MPYLLPRDTFGKFSKRTRKKAVHKRQMKIVDVGSVPFSWIFDTYFINASLISVYVYIWNLLRDIWSEKEMKQIDSFYFKKQLCQFFILVAFKLASFFENYYKVTLLNDSVSFKVKVLKV
jgi:hypothetical protein